QSWRLDSASRHPGALLRLKLRSGGAPLMMAVGGRSRIPREERSCRICGNQDLDTAEHFLCKCHEYLREREECVRRLRLAVAAHTTPQLSPALDSATVELFQ